MNDIFLIKGGFKIVYIFLLCGMFFGCAATRNKMKEHSPSTVPEVRNLEEECGIKIIGPRLTAEGYMIDFRYRVIDPEKAAPIFDREAKPYLIDQESGGKLQLPEFPKTGFLRTTIKPVADMTYYMFFVNPDKIIKKGSKVSVVIGDFRAENLILE